MSLTEEEVTANFNNATQPIGQVVNDPVLIFGPKHDPYYIVIPITIIYVLIFVSGLFGNICTCIVITRNRSMHTATNYYLFSLAVSDLLLLVSGLPQEIWSIWSKWPFAFGESFCVLRGLAAETSANASVLTITFFTIERYFAICHPFLSHTMSKLSRAIKHILVVWVISFGLALPQALQFGLRVHLGVVLCVQTKVIIAHSFEVSTFLFFFAPMALITALYALIALRLSKSRIKRNRSAGRQAAVDTSRTTGSVHKKQGQSTRRVVKMLVAVVTAFFLCWAPFHAQRLVAIYGTSDNHQARTPAMLVLYGIITYLSGVLYYLSTAVNPILYHIMSNKFRDAFKRTLAAGCCGLGAFAPGARPRLNSSMVVRRNTAVSCSDYSGHSVRDEITCFTHGPLTRQRLNNGNGLIPTYTNGSGRSTSRNRNPSLKLNGDYSSSAKPKTSITSLDGPRHYLHYPAAASKHIHQRINSPQGNIQNNQSVHGTYQGPWNFLNCTAATKKKKTNAHSKIVSMDGSYVKSKKDPVHATISNSSLMEAESKDLEDELNCFMEEVRNLKFPK